MIEKGFGGGNTITGLNFEKECDILTLLGAKEGYVINGASVLYEGKEVARSLKKNALYVYLKSKGVDFRDFISKRLLPDEAIYVEASNTLFIVEIKFQKVGGSVDEKLQTCDFKRKQYSKLMASIGVQVEYIYILSEWFENPSYKDVLNYILSVGCHFYFKYLPLEKLGLPNSK